MATAAATIRSQDGRFNVSQGVVATTQGLGAAISASLAGSVIVWAGYGASFLTLAAIAVAGLLLYLVAMPETKTQHRADQSVT